LLLLRWWRWLLLLKAGDATNPSGVEDAQLLLLLLFAAAACCCCCCAKRKAACCCCCGRGGGTGRRAWCGLEVGWLCWWGWRK